VFEVAEPDDAEAPPGSCTFTAERSLAAIASGCGALALGTVVLSLRQDYHHYRHLVIWGPNSAHQWMAQVAANLHVAPDTIG
jgi:hypothetical protein